MKKRPHNIGLAIWRLKCFYDTFVQGSTAVILLNFCGENPPHRQAEKRYNPFKKKHEQSDIDLIKFSHYNQNICSKQ
jgi:hypothetical protein